MCLRRGRWKAPRNEAEAVLEEDAVGVKTSSVDCEHATLKETEKRSWSRCIWKFLD
jgi:hypothetical protein